MTTMKKLIVSLMALFAVLTVSAQHIYDFKVMDGMLRKQDADYDKKSDIKWNFTKFLVSRDGRVLKRYEPTEPMATIDADIQQAVKK